MSLNNPANPLKVSGGAAVSFDDTMTESNGVYSVTRPVHPILTQAEYDALPEAERNKGVYVVSDGEDAGEESGSSGSGEVYSTEEIRVGTWFGKPLYRVAFDTVLPDTTGTGKSLVAVPTNFDKAVKISAVFLGEYKDWITIPYCTVTSGSVSHYIWLYIYNGYIMVSFDTNGWRGKEIHIILEYTKTTD